MVFNVDKCSVIHFGFNNNGSDLTLGGRLLEVHESERDLGVMVQCNLKVDKQVHESERDLGAMVQCNLKVDKQCCKATNEANRKLGMIKRGFKNKSKEIMLPLYKSMVRPHLEYCICTGMETTSQEGC